MYRNRPADPKDETFDWYSDCGMANQDPSNLNNDKFTLTLSDGATRPPNILDSPEIRENQTITQTSPTLSTFPHTQDSSAETAHSSLSITPDDTVTSQDTALITPSLAHDATEPSMTPPTDSTLDSDGAAASADTNQASKDVSELPNPEGVPAETQQTGVRKGGKKRRRRRKKTVGKDIDKEIDKDSIQSDSDSMEASGDVHQGRTYEVSEQREDSEIKVS